MKGQKIKGHTLHHETGAEAAHRPSTFLSLPSPSQASAQRGIGGVGPACQAAWRWEGDRKSTRQVLTEGLTPQERLKQSRDPASSASLNLLSLSVQPLPGARGSNRCSHAALSPPRVLGGRGQHTKGDRDQLRPVPTRGTGGKKKQPPPEIGQLLWLWRCC